MDDQKHTLEPWREWQRKERAARANTARSPWGVLDEADVDEGVSDSGAPAASVRAAMLNEATGYTRAALAMVEGDR